MIGIPISALSRQVFRKNRGLLKKFQKPLAKQLLLCYTILANRGIAQLVEQWSPKPRVLSSSLSAPAMKKQTFVCRTKVCFFNDIRSLRSRVIYLSVCILYTITVEMKESEVDKMTNMTPIKSNAILFAD